MMKTNWHYDAPQKRGESIPSLHRIARKRASGELER